mmetsp:Transcript_27949/g.32044  ORF Transcript_27949/g.32044 Transcript_27949/m.32044 type:complete len:195 (-) Transcript_27949:18-602(-)
MFKGMEDMKIDSQLTQEEMHAILTEVKDLSNESDGFIKCWISDANPANFYALFNKTKAVKPFSGTSEWTFKKSDLENKRNIAMKYTESIETKLASKGVDLSECRVTCYKEEADLEDGTYLEAIRDTILITFTDTEPQAIRRLKYINELEEEIKYLCVVEPDCTVIPIQTFRGRTYELPAESLLQAVQEVVLGTY